MDKSSSSKGPDEPRETLETEIVGADEGVEEIAAMENSSNWSGMQTGLVHGDPCAMGQHAPPGGVLGHVYKVGIYGWRKRCLYLFVLLLMVMVIINMALLIWIIKVMDFSVNGMGKLRILEKGIRLEGEAEFIQSLYTTTLESRKNVPLTIESARNLTLNARNQRGQIVNRLFIGDRKIESIAERFTIKNPSGKVLFSAVDEEIEVAADSLKVTGSGGAVFDGSIQTPLVVAEPGSQLRLESPTRSLEVEAPNGIALESKAGDIAAVCLSDLKLQSTGGAITLESPNIIMRDLPKASTASTASNAQPVDTVFQLCACMNGRLFLAPSSGFCKGDNSIC